CVYLQGTKMPSTAMTLLFLTHSEVCMYARVWVCVCGCVYLCLCLCMCMCVYMYVCVCVCADRHFLCGLQNKSLSTEVLYLSTFLEGQWPRTQWEDMYPGDSLFSQF